MTITMDNIKMTKDELDSLERKVESNIATVQDYEKIDSFLFKSGLSESYLLTNLKKEGIYSFDELKQFIDNPPEPRNPSREGKVVGIVLGLISFLKNQL